MIDKALIFTDGASRGNPGPGGWGAVIIEGGNVIELGDGETKTTNNRMELTAALEAIKKTPKGAKLTIYTDSSYLINGITKWVFGWLKNDWKTKEKKEVLNKDIWQELQKVTTEREIEWQQVKGHAGIAGNNRADEIATSFADRNSPDLFQGDRIHYALDIKKPTEEQLSVASDRERKNAKAYSYLSLVDNELKKHSDWASCKERVEGKQGAKFRKAISQEDENEILKGWGMED